MKILLDHCLPRKLARSFPSHAVLTTASQGWSKLQNGKLLAAAGARFDLFLTVDKSIKREHNLSKLPISIVVVRAKGNRLDDLLPFVAAIESAIARLKPKTLIEITRS